MLPKDFDRAGTPPGVFGTELRHYRTEAGLSQTELAARAFMSHDVISKIETGERPPADDTPVRLDAVPELETRGALTRLWQQLRKSLRHRAYPGWFHDWPDKEAAAQTLRWYEPLIVPGLLQTSDYARAVLRTRVGDSDEQINEMVAARLDRQAILDRDTPPTLWVVIDEGVLHRPVGGPAVMGDQVRHLIEAAQRPNIVLQVIPLKIGAHEGLRGPFVIADFEDGLSLAWQDAAVFGQLVDVPSGISSLMAMWDTLKSEALSRSASLELMEEVAKTWT